ncbi:WD40 repeat domain-containing protein, partial [Aerosakkonema sp. BLCC-F183]|uniref:WD40 repeat domain-containing protein n=1 Tax=Aerosakkonema sp. BLCC-F183 TaxID=3342834 RepID=UPI0035B900E1
DGKYIVSGSADKTVRLWDSKGNPIGQPLVGHQESVTSVTVTPDGKYIVSGSADKTVRLWDIKGNPIGEPLVGHESAVTSVAVTPDGKYIVSGSYDKTVRLWQGGDWQTWLSVGCNRLREHPVLVHPETEEAKSAAQTCRKYVWKDADVGME